MREWEEVGEMGVGGGGPGVASVGVEGGEGVVELEEVDGEATSSQVSATALEVLGLAEDEMARFLREDSSPGVLRDVVVIAISKAKETEGTAVFKQSCVYSGANA